MLKSHQISLRLLEDNDLEFLYSIENNADNKKYGANNGYLSKKTLRSLYKKFRCRYKCIWSAKICYCIK
jgi:hypothetical protein